MKPQVQESELNGCWVCNGEREVVTAEGTIACVCVERDRLRVEVEMLRDLREKAWIERDGYRAEVERLRAAVRESSRLAHEAMDSERRWCAEVERLKAERDRYREALERIAFADSRELSILDEASALAREALDG